LQQVTTVHVLSSPELLVLDNQPARLQVGSVVPYLSQSSQSQIVTNAPIVSSINYQQTGVIMEVTPRVNSGGLVTLDVMQDVSSVQQGT
jgi:general secretion pathway protein D